MKCPPTRRHIVSILVMLYGFLALSSLSAQGFPPQTEFKLDSVNVGLAGIRIDSKIHTSSAGDLAQVAYFVSARPYREISIIVVPFGFKPGAEVVPVAAPGATGDYEEALRAFRESQGGIAQYAPVVKIFGRKTVGMSHLVSLPIDGPKPKLVSITEWVAEAGDRMWILRVSQEVSDLEAGEKAGDALADLTLTADRTLRNRSTLDTRSRARIAPAAPGTEGGLPSKAVGDLPLPAWWNGSDCDNNHFQAVSGQSSFRLGGVYRGVPACGPRPLAGGADVVASFPGVDQYEWECVELAKRYLYLAYGIDAYSANGKDMVQNYPGTLLQKVSNGTPGSAPQAGDVLSYGPATTYGHTSVVASSSVPSSGTCTGCIQVIEQNNSASGQATLSISNWTVTGGPYPVSGWLHYPAAVPSTPGSPSPGSSGSPGPVLSSATAQLSWGSSSGATYYSLGVRDLTTNALVVDTTTTGTSYAAALSPGRPYRWNVAACNATGCSSYTTPLYFQTPSSVPVMPGSTSPGSTTSPGPVLASATVQLSWGSSSGATYYSLGVRDLTTNALVVDTTTSGTSYTAALSPGRPYRWNVAACNATGCSSYTTPLYFQTP
ncbi:MAG TPA: CHAP domain-containing protein [Thermoanaerobaculia bacterium]